MTDLTSNLVQCIKCRKCTSSKGIFTHFARTHADEKTKMKFNSGASAATKLKISMMNFTKLLLKLKTYYACPKFCKGCECELDWFKRDCNFCSHSCAAIFNKDKIPKVSEETKNKIKQSLSKYFKHTKEDFLSNFVGPVFVKVLGNKPKRLPLPCETDGEYSIIYHCKCKFCQTRFIKRTPIRICAACKDAQNKLRMDYRFTFNVFDYPELFDLTLLAEVGWYGPRGKSGKWNPAGLSRDHKISVSAAIKHSYNPFYISHPLNCDLMPHTQNNMKKQKCSISYDELKSLVDEFERVKNKIQKD